MSLSWSTNPETVAKTPARQALNKARLAAEILGLVEDIFTVKTYTLVPLPDFIAINDEMLAALDQGRLWDGMILPPSQKSDDGLPSSH